MKIFWHVLVLPTRCQNIETEGGDFFMRCCEIFPFAALPSTHSAQGTPLRRRAKFAAPANPHYLERKTGLDPSLTLRVRQPTEKVLDSESQATVNASVLRHDPIKPGTT